MQPRKRTHPPSTPSTRGPVVASFTVSESGSIPRAPAQNLPSVLEGRVQSSASTGPFVEWSGSPAPTLARVLWLERTPDWSKCIGLRVALVFEGGEESRPIVVGLLEAPPIEARSVPELEAPEVWTTENVPASDKPEILRIESTRELRIECGKASILLRADGKLELRGEYVLSRATGPNKIKGGSVQIN